MSFVWFRKYHKPFLWFAVIFTIVVFATFSGMSDLDMMMSGNPADEVVGEFRVEGTGEIRRVTSEEFQATFAELNRLAYANSRNAKVEEDDVWEHLMTLADARAAGLEVAVDDLARMFPPDMTKEQYRSMWNDVMQFPSARDFEDFLRSVLLVERYRAVSVDAARIVGVDEVYLRWRTDNERFDIDAVVIPDLAVDAVPDPQPDVLQFWWDAMPEMQRNARFVQPQTQDIVYAWLPLVGGTDGLSDEQLAALPEPDAQEVDARYEQVAPQRWPEAEAMDDATRAELVRELKLIGLAQQQSSDFEALEEKSAEAFIAAATAAGFRVVNPEGELGPEEIKSLEGIGDATLALWLGQRKAGDLHFGYPWAGQDYVSLVYLETVTPSRPLSFDEARDAAVTAWKERQLDTPARDFRELVRTRTRELPEVAELLAPALESAAQRAEEAVAAAPDLDEAGREALRKQMLDLAELNEVQPRLAEHEHRVWADLPLPEGARRVALEGVSQSYIRNPDDALEAPDSIERFLKSNGTIFRLGVNGISEPLRHLASKQSAVVIVKSRSFPEQAAMLADPAGLESARQQLAAQRQNEVRMSFLPEALKASHELKLLNQPDVN